MRRRPVTVEMSARIAELAPSHSDREVAEMLGIGRHQARHRRLKLDIEKKPGRYSPLVRRQDELKKLMAEGLKPKAIASAMGVSETAVRDYLHRLGYVTRSRTEYVLVGTPGESRDEA